MFTTTSTSDLGSCGIDTSTLVVNVLTTSAGSITSSDTMCLDSTMTLLNSITGGVWSTTGLSTINTSGMLTATSIGTDTVTYTISNSCGIFLTTKTIVIKDCSLGIDNVTTTNISIYPNPVSDYLNIKLNTNTNKVTISNIMGQVVFHKTYTQNDISINMIDIPQGVYTLSINNTSYKS